MVELMEFPLNLFAKLCLTLVSPFIQITSLLWHGFLKKSKDSQVVTDFHLRKSLIFIGGSAKFEHSWTSTGRDVQ